MYNPGLLLRPFSLTDDQLFLTLKHEKQRLKVLAGEEGVVGLFFFGERLFSREFFVGFFGCLLVFGVF